MEPGTIVPVNPEAVSQGADDEHDLGWVVPPQRVLTAEDLMRLHLEDDPLVFGELSLCVVCTDTCGGCTVST